MTIAELDIRLWRDPVLGRTGVELLAGEGRSFGPLIRNEATIAIVTDGTLRARIGGCACVVRAGQAILVPAGETFAGDSADRWSWRVFFPDLDTLAELSPGHLAGPPPRGPQPAEPSEDRERIRRLITLHRALEGNVNNPLARQQAFTDAMAEVLGGVVRPVGWPRRPRPESCAVRRAIGCVHQRFHDPELSVAELAAAAGYSSYHFMRRFQTAVGVTAHAYIVQCRVHAARLLLAQGTASAEVASATGFADQSHLIRQFKALHGVTPGQYSEACRQRGGRRPAAAGERPGVPRRD